MNKEYIMDMTIEEYQAFIQHLLDQATAET